MRPVTLCLLAALAVAPVAAPAADRAAVAAQKLADDYVATRAEPEHASGVSISVSLPGAPEAIDVVAGAVSRDPGAAPITSGTVLQIGGIPKSFTAAAPPQLQTEGRLDLDQTRDAWLPEYPAWKHVTIRRLLNMTSGIPTYDDTAAALDSVAAIGPGRRFTPEVLVGFADPTYPGVLAATTGYAYSNANYILAGMIIEKATGRSVAEEFADRFFGPRYGLTDAYYAAGPYPDAVTDRRASGYFRQPEITEMKALLGADMRRQDMSWAGAAGAIVAIPGQVDAWVRALFQSDLLTEAARGELTSVVSMTTGEPIAGTSADDPHGFGLGVSGFTSPALGDGRSYEGGTMGFRGVYGFAPAEDLVAAVALNSQPAEADDRIGKRVAAVLEAAR